MTTPARLALRPGGRSIFCFFAHFFRASPVAQNLLDFQRSADCGSRQIAASAVRSLRVLPPTATTHDKEIGK